MPVKLIALTPMHAALPLYPTAAAAGFPSPGEDHTPDMLDLNDLLIKHPTATFFMQVEGDSIIDARIYSGDIVIVDRALTPHHGSIVIAIVRNELIIKRLERRNDTWFLVSENPAYEPIRVDQDLEESMWGVVTFTIHRTR